MKKTNLVSVLHLIALVLSACCHGNRERCQEYLKWTQLANLLSGNASLNNIVYTLAAGHHVMEGGLHSFQFTNNFTLKGSPDGSTVIHCNSTNQLCRILFKQSENINIHNLTFVYPNRNTTIKSAETTPGTCYKSRESNQENYKYYKHCEHFKSWVFSDTKNVTVTNVQFIGPDGNWMIIGPIGSYQIHNVTFSTLTYSHGFVNIAGKNESDNIIVFILLSKLRNVSFTCKVSNITFIAPSYIQIEKRATINQVSFHSTAIHIVKQKYRTMNNSRIFFINSSIEMENIWADNQSIIQLNIDNCKGLLVNLTNITGRGGWSAYRNITKYVGERFIGSAIRVYIERELHSEGCHIRDPPKSKIAISDGIFSNYLSVKGSGLLYEVDHYNNDTEIEVEVIVSKCMFKINPGLEHANVIYANQSENFGKEVLNFLHPVTLILDKLNIERNPRTQRIGACILGIRKIGYFYQESYQSVKLSCPNAFPWLGAVHLEGFQRHRAKLSNIIIYFNGGKGISLVNSVIQVLGTNRVNYNIASYGAGILLKGKSLMLFHNNTNLSIANNWALQIGGGMYIMDNCTFDLKPLNECYCFFQFIHENGSLIENITLKYLNVTINFKDNRADERVANLFNTNIDKCKLETEIDKNRTQLFHHLFHAPHGDMNSSFYMSSLPRRIANCNDSENDELSQINIYKGQNVTMDLMVLADLDLPIEAVVFFNREQKQFVNQTTIRISLPLVYNLKLDDKCNKVIIPWSYLKKHINFTIEFTNLQINTPIFSLAPNTIVPQNLFLYKLVNISIFPTCPPGFIINETDNRCECNPYLIKHKMACKLSNTKLTIPGLYWIGQMPHNSSDVYFSKSCHPGFCRKSNKSVDLSSNPDEQCMFGRRGILCSKCPKGMSAVYGSNECKPCFIHRVLLTVLAFLLLGPLMVITMCYFNLTIATRTLNGFLLYICLVNISVDVRRSQIAEESTIFSILSLDLGYGLCLYNGSDQFAAALFDLLFPLYLLLIVASAILLPKSKCLNSQRLHKAVGPRVIPVLATITWLSCSHTSVAVISSLHPTDLCNTVTETCRKVWIYDGELEYFGCWKHILVGAIALLMLIFILLPIALIAIFGDLLRRCINKKFYLNFLDAFHASYRQGYGFWVGIRLMIPNIIVLLKTVFTGLEQQQVDLAIVIVFIIILCFQVVTNPFRDIQFDRCLPQSLKRKMTKKLSKKIANLLDMSFLLNVILLYSFLAQEKKEIAKIVIILSRVVAVGEFLMIVLYHFLEYTSLGGKLITKVTILVSRIKRLLKVKSVKRSNEDGDSSPTGRVNTVYLELNRAEESSCESETENEVRSEDTGSDSEEDLFKRANQLREPLITTPTISLQ